MKIASLVLSALLGGGLTYFALDKFNTNDTSNNSTQKIKKPSYWVAPMDANYRRDKPGKSPMGMDLIPFYEEKSLGPDEGPGTIRISPTVVNNLGVRTSYVELKSLNSSINTVGYVNFDENTLVHIHPRVQGWVEKLYIKATGDKVKKGQALYALYSPEMVNAQEEYLLALSRNNSRLIKASKNRLISLHIPRSEIRNIEKTRRVKQTVTFYSPITGVVDKLKIRQGFYVKPGTNLMTIGSLKQVWVNAEIFERQAAEIKTGVLVEMNLDYIPGKIWKGKVDYIYPIVDTKTRTIKVRLKFDNEDEVLKPGMFAQILIHGIKSKKTLVIPKEALIRTGNSKRVVLALGEGKFKSINVKVGRITENEVEVLSTLKEGDKIVTSAQFLLDSESSKNSDFLRMSEIKEKDRNNSSNVVWTNAKVIKLMPEDNAIKVNHGAISSWKWPSMIMNFELADNIKLKIFKIGMDIDIEITKTHNNTYLITNIKTKDIDNKEWANATVLKLMPEDNAIKVTHSKIPAWKWPSMTMNFEIDKKLYFKEFKVGMNMDIEITKTINNTYIITNIKNIGVK